MTNTYTIQAGDNLSKIAKAHNTTVENLARINGISDPNKIKKGATIKLFEDKQPKEVKQPITQEDFNTKMDTLQKELNVMQSQMNNKTEGFDTLDMFGMGLAGAATYKVAEKTLPYAWSAAKTGTKTVGNAVKVIAKTATQAGEATANGMNSLRKTLADKAKHLAKKIELEYAFGKDAVKQGAKKAGNEIVRTTKQGVKLVKKTNVRATRILNGEKTTINGKLVKPLGKAGKVLGKAAVPLTIATSMFEIGQAYEKGGTKEAAKQGAKCATGVAAGWAGAKVGAAIGTAICPGIGTAIGGFVGGIAGYLIGERVAKKVVD